MVLSDFELRFGGRQQGASTVRRGLDLIVGRLGYRARRYQATVACFLCGSLQRAGASRIHITDLGRDGVRVVCAVQTQEGLTLMHHLTTIHETLNDFARNAKTQIALDASGYNPCECSSAGLGGLHYCDLHELRDGSRVLRGM